MAEEPENDSFSGMSPDGSEQRDSGTPVNEIVTADVPDEEPSTPPRLPFPTVGIGASAGGLEACIELLAGLPPDAGAAFVLVPHLAPAHESHFVEILTRHTKMPVSEIENGVEPQPNHLYVLPPNAQATISSGRLHLEPRPEDERIPRPIDRFFRSLASDQKNHVIGVILSGTDADGALGLRAIKGEGGIAIVQSPDSARFPEMPRSGIAADHVDVVLPPAQIGKELARLVRDFARPEVQPLKKGEIPVTDEPDLDHIMKLLKRVSGIDFRVYKQSMIGRRLARRMMLKRIDDLREYAQLLQLHPPELHDLQDDLLISVTRFFRDPEVFDTLQNELLPRLLADRPPDQQIRVWVPGCSTGEEAYSIAICLLEYLGREDREPSIQIFGTDASDRSIEKARLGIYPASMAGEVSPGRLQRYFLKTDHGYQVAKRVRDQCIFARQNLCNDPPFSRLDLISCRNVLIYLGAEIQKKIIATFHYALKPSGYLLLGNTESLRNHADLFTAVDRKYKFYAKLPTGGRPVLDFPSLRFEQTETKRRAPTAANGPAAEWDNVDLQRAADRIVLARYVPAGVVINKQMQVLQVRGHTSPYLEIAPGTPSLHLLEMARGALAPALREAVQRAVQQDIPVRIEEVRMSEGDRSQEIAIEVLPIPGGPGAQQRYLVTFLPRAEPPVEVKEATSGASLPSTAEDKDREILQLREDLASTRLYLQSLIEERDARNQDLTGAYEEVQTANEELQSSNEELETAKEELQSTNEELQTVNDELRNRNTALTQVSNDLANLFSSINVPLVMLGNDLTVRHFTPRTERLMHVRSADIGRPIREIKLNLLIEDVESPAREVLETLSPKELEVEDRQGGRHLLRIRPYRTADNKIDGVVMLLLDVTEIRKSEAAMREARDLARGVLEAVQVPVVALDEELRIRTANARFRALSGLASEELERRSFPELAYLLWHINGLRPALEKLVQGAEIGGFEEEYETTSGGQSQTLHLNARAAAYETGRILLITVEDTTERTRAERVMMREQERLAGQVEETAQALGRTRQELQVLTGKLFASQEEERRRVARELHDDVVQELALLQMETERLEQALPTDLDEMRRGLDNLRNRAAVLAEDVRALSHGLHPSALDDLGVKVALRQLVDEFHKNTNIPVTFHSRHVPDNIPLDTATAIYRITQEALRNVAKHAGETHVRVTVIGSDSRLRLTIRDLGEGFDTAEITRGGLGLISMEERARLLGGSFRIVSALGEGTTVEVEIPLEKPGTDREEQA